MLAQLMTGERVWRRELAGSQTSLAADRKREEVRVEVRHTKLIESRIRVISLEFEQRDIDKRCL